MSDLTSDCRSDINLHSESSDNGCDNKVEMEILKYPIESWPVNENYDVKPKIDYALINLHAPVSEFQLRLDFTPVEKDAAFYNKIEHFWNELRKEKDVEKIKAKPGDSVNIIKETTNDIHGVGDIDFCLCERYKKYID